MNVFYFILYGGYYDKEEVLVCMFMLSKIIFYFMFLFIDVDNWVRKIYMGFDGLVIFCYEIF